MISGIRRACLLLCLCLLAFPLFAQDAAPRIGVMTMRPGEIFWERFGHDAIVVEDPATGEQLNYNFGFFDPAAPDFVSRFARGEMRYQLAVLPTAADLQMYRSEGRGVSIQWLNLSPAQANALATALRRNAQPENAFYDYRYFTDNCATRVRDALNAALGGAIEKQLQSRSRGLTYRSEAVRLADNALWMRYLFDLGLGPKADQPMNLWQAAFVPGHLESALNDIQVDGKPLVASEQEILGHQLRPDAKDPVFIWWQWLIAGIALGLLYAWTARRFPRIYGVLAVLTWIKFAVFGLVLVYLWGFTVHDFAWRNQNLWLLNPLSLLCAGFWWQAPKSARQSALLRSSAVIVDLVLPIAGLFAYWFTMGAQSNAHWLALLLPLHLGLYFGARQLQWRNGRHSDPAR